VEIIRMLKAGWPQHAILRRVPVGPGIVLALSKKLGASCLKSGGRGRRFTPELWKQILEAVKTHRTSREVQVEFGIDDRTVRKARNEIGDFENRRLRMKLTIEQIAQGTQMLRDGARWDDVAIALGVRTTTLLRYIGYRKHGNRRAVIHRMSDERLEEIRVAIIDGRSRRDICAEFGCCRKTIGRIVRILRRQRRSNGASGASEFIEQRANSAG
jgi:uncharacterized protein YerC